MSRVLLVTSELTRPPPVDSTHIDAHLSGIRFFYKLIRNTEGWEAE